MSTEDLAKVKTLYLAAEACRDASAGTEPWNALCDALQSVEDLLGIQRNEHGEAILSVEDESLIDEIQTRDELP